MFRWQVIQKENPRREGTQYFYGVMTAFSFTIITISILAILGVIGGTANFLIQKKIRQLRNLVKRPLLLDNNPVYSEQIEPLNLLKIFNDLGADGYALRLMESYGLFEKSLLEQPIWNRSQQIESIFSVEGDYPRFIENTNRTIAEIETRKRSDLKKNLPVAIMQQRVLDFENLHRFGRIKDLNPDAKSPIISPPQSDRTFVDLDQLPSLSLKYMVGGSLAETFFNVGKWWDQRNLRKLRDNLDACLVEYAKVFALYIDKKEVIHSVSEASRSWNSEIARLDSLLSEVDSLKEKPLLAKYVVSEALKNARDQQQRLRAKESAFLGGMHQNLKLGKYLEVGHLVYMNRALLFKNLPGADFAVREKTAAAVEELRHELLRLDASGSL